MFNYTYGYTSSINYENLYIEKTPFIYTECSIPDEIFDTENYTLIDKIPKQVVVKSQRIYIKERDYLFWTFYVLHNGVDEFNQIGTKNIVNEKKEKLYIIDNVIHKNTNLLKEYKIRITKHIIENLAYDSKINFQTFQVLCILHKISFIIKYKKCFYECKLPDTSVIVLPIIIEVHKNKNNRIYLSFDKTINYSQEFINDNINISSCLGFTCYCKWTGVKKKAPKKMLLYTDEIQTIGDLLTE
jgi:hypothetical protein